MSSALSVPPIIEVVAIVGGGLSGALHARNRGMDFIGIVLVAVATGVGGGAIRDVLLGQAVPVFLLNDFVLLAVMGALGGYFFAQIAAKLEPINYVIDSLLIGAWVVIGSHKALGAGLSFGAAAFLGVMTAVGGGLVRDVLCRDIPTAFMPGKWVAGSALLAAVVYVVLAYLGAPQPITESLAVFTAMFLRLLSARFRWITPDAVDMSERMRGWLGLRRSAPLMHRAESPTE